MSVAKVQHRSVPGLPIDHQPEKYTEKPIIEAIFKQNEAREVIGGTFLQGGPAR